MQEGRAAVAVGARERDADLAVFAGEFDDHRDSATRRRNRASCRRSPAWRSARLRRHPPAARCARSACRRALPSRARCRTRPRLVERFRPEMLARPAGIFAERPKRTPDAVAVGGDDAALPDRADAERHRKEQEDQPEIERYQYRCQDRRHGLLRRSAWPGTSRDRRSPFDSGEPSVCGQKKGLTAPRAGDRMTSERAASEDVVDAADYDSERADPHRHRDKERAHADQRNDILKQIGHSSLLFLMCFYFVLFLFKLSRTIDRRLLTSACAMRVKGRTGYRGKPCAG